MNVCLVNGGYGTIIWFSGINRSIFNGKAMKFVSFHIWVLYEGLKMPKILE